MTVLVVYYEDGTHVDVDVKAKYMVAAEARFPNFDSNKVLTSGFQVAFCAAKAAGDPRTWEVWLDAVDRIEGEPETGETEAAEDQDPTGRSPGSPPSPPATG